MSTDLAVADSLDFVVEDKKIARQDLAQYLADSGALDKVFWSGPSFRTTPIPPGKRHNWRFTHDLMFKRVLSHPRALDTLIHAALPEVHERRISEIILKANDPNNVTNDLIAEAKSRNIAIDVVPQKVISSGVTGRQAILDVFVRLADGTLIDFEMQTLAHGFNTPRIRFYSAQMDTMAFERGASVEDAPDTYVVFFCLFDPFGLAQAKYLLNATIQVATTGQYIGATDDGRHAIVFNAKGALGPGVEDPNSSEITPSPEMIDILRYMATGEISGLTPGPGILDELVAFENNSGRWLEGMFPIGEKLDHYEQQHEEDLKLIADLKRRLQEQDRQLKEKDLWIAKLMKNSGHPPK